MLVIIAGRSPKPQVGDIEYGPNAHLHDLYCVYQKYCADSNAGTFVVGHSFGTSQVLRLLNIIKAKDEVPLPIGVALLGAIVDVVRVASCTCLTTQEFSAICTLPVTCCWWVTLS